MPGSLKAQSACPIGTDRHYPLHEQTALSDVPHPVYPDPPRCGDLLAAVPGCSAKMATGEHPALARGCL
jgi:hypothetical protein